MSSSCRVLLLLPFWFALSAASAGELSKATLPIPEIVAAFDNVKINREEVRRCLWESFTSPGPGKQVLNTFVQRLMILRKAKALGVTVSPAEIRKKLAELESKAGGREALATQLRDSARSWYRPEAVVEEMLLVENVVRKMEGAAAGEQLSPELIRAAFEKLNQDYSPKINSFRPDPAAVVATVAGRDYTAGDALAFIVATAAPEKIRAAVSRLINNKMALHEAETRGLLPTPMDLEKVLARVREEISKQNRLRPGTVHLTLNGLLASQGRSLEEFKQSLQIRAEAARLKLLAGKLTAEALAKEYADTRDDYLIVKCSHILMAYDPKRPYRPKDVTAARKTELRKKVAEVDNLLRREKGYPRVPKAVFEKLVESYTDCPSRAFKGDIGYTANTPALAPFLPPMAYSLDFLHDDANRAFSPISARFALLIPEFLPTVLALHDGEVSSPVETPYGFHIFRRSEVRYPTSWQAIRGLLSDHLRQRLTEELSRSLLKKYPVEYYWEVLKVAEKN